MDFLFDKTIDLMNSIVRPHDYSSSTCQWVSEAGIGLEDKRITIRPSSLRKIRGFKN